MPSPNVKSSFLCNRSHNKHHISHIVMEEVMKPTSHMCHESQLLCEEKAHFSCSVNFIMVKTLQ